MDRSRCSIFAAGILVAIIGTPARGEQAELTVLLYNCVNLNTSVVSEALDQASRVLGNAGVLIKPAACDEAGGGADRCAATGRPTTVVVRIYTSPQRALRNMDLNSFGFALPSSAPEFGFFAAVFYDRIRLLSNPSPTMLGRVLGHVVAHEVGHLLLTMRGHTASGLMKVPWDKKQLERIDQGSLLFSSAEAAQIRANVLARMRAAGALAKVE
ncbi:MAG: hypothetical protein HYZ57_08480 [Acidobacteria bacterium]|nr:hypothetical protein [Acidobacteriota bacterium]